MIERMFYLEVDEDIYLRQNPYNYCFKDNADFYKSLRIPVFRELEPVSLVEEGEEDEILFDDIPF